MAVVRKAGDSKPPRRRPADSIEGRETQLAADAVALAEKQMADGTISSQNLNYYLKISGSQHKEELEKARLENKLLEAKIEQMGSMKEQEELYRNALQAFSSYQGRDEEDFDEG